MPSVTVTPSSACTVDRNRTSKIDIRLATVDEMLAKASILFEEHYEEIARNKQVMKLKPNWPMYEAVDQGGFLFIYLAMQDDVCIGYSMNIIMHHFHYADLRVAQNDVLVVKKEFRGGRLGLR